MSKVLYIICEGETEQEFCKHILTPHFLQKSIILYYPLIERSGGGIVRWEFLKRQILKHLGERDAYVSTFIDMYGLTSGHAFPDWENLQKIHHVKNRMRVLESNMEKDVNHRRFIANIVVHEFESLLFSDISAIQKIVPPNELKYSDLQRALAQFNDVEIINDSPSTAPSKRLEAAITGYIKPLHGHYIAEEIGLPTIREKCEKFNEWIVKLENI